MLVVIRTTKAYGAFERSTVLASRYSTWRLQRSSFLGRTCFLIGDLNRLLKEELRRSRQEHSKRLYSGPTLNAKPGDAAQSLGDAATWPPNTFSVRSPQIHSRIQD